MVRHRPNRTGFTLVELLVVILIIGGLIALLIPTVFAAFRKAREAQVTSEMSNLATALASFKNAYGDYPPSRVILCEAGFNSLPAGFLSATVGAAAAVPPELPLADGNSTDMTNQQLVTRSLLYLRKFWPRTDFLNNSVKLDAGGNPIPGTWNDFDGDGLVNSSAIVLNGSECLTFFLGGIPLRGAAGITGLSGFNKSPIAPFVKVPDPSSAYQIGTNRTVPNYEFNNGRLIDQDGDGIASYIDPINVNPSGRVPYAYFVSYGVNGYDPNDVNGNGHLANPVYELEEDLSTVVQRGFLVNFPVFDGTGNLKTPPGAVSPAPNPYTSGPSALGTVSWYNPTSFQIVCAGQDGLWGLGGTYSSSGGAFGKLPILPVATDPGNINVDDTTSIRNRETDNLTNFSGGRLD